MRLIAIILQFIAIMWLIATIVQVIDIMLLIAIILQVITIMRLIASELHLTRLGKKAPRALGSPEWLTSVLKAVFEGEHILDCFKITSKILCCYHIPPTWIIATIMHFITIMWLISILLQALAIMSHIIALMWFVVIISQAIVVISHLIETH